MLEDIRGYLAKRSRELGLDRADKLAEIQAYLDKLYPGQCRAMSINSGVLKITTPNASVASELRFKSEGLVVEMGVKKIFIKIA
jgi:hypothetical protein